MRRLVFLGLVFATACLSDGTSPTSITGIVVNSSASPFGVFVGDQVQLSPQAHDPAGDIVPVSFTYKSSNTSVATVDANGLITALSAGTTSIGIATIDQSASLTLMVDGNITKTIVLTPPSATISPAEQVQFTATVMTTLGNPARNKSLVWSSTNTSVVAIDTTGLVTGVAATSGATVCAATTDAPAIKGCAMVVVQPPNLAALRR